MKTCFRGNRDFEALEKRRLQAARLFGKGKSQAEVVCALGVSRQSVSRWYHTWQQAGKPGLKAAGRAGRKPKLTAAQLGQVEQELLRGPLAHGYATILWTLPRIAALIAKLTGVKYHPGHVWRILRDLDWSLQRPEHRAKERDDEAITRWVKRRWPQRKKGRSAEAPGSFTTTRAASRSDPPLCAPGPPRGQTPIVQMHFNWKRLSMTGSLALAPDLSRVRTFLSPKPGSVDGPSTIAFLRSLRRHIPAPVLLVWDGLPAHVSRLTRDWIASQHRWLEVEWLPPYAPELNPVEYLWRHLDATHLANFAPDDLAQLEAQVRRGIRRVRHRDDLAFAFLKHSGLYPEL